MCERSSLVLLWCVRRSTIVERTKVVLAHFVTNATNVDQTMAHMFAYSTLNSRAVTSFSLANVAFVYRC